MSITATINDNQVRATLAGAINIDVDTLALATPAGATMVGTASSGTVQDALLYTTPQQKGAAADGTTDDTTPLTNAIATGRTAMSGTLRTTSQINITTSNHVIDGGGDAEISKDHGGNCLLIMPTGVALGAADAASTTTTIKIAGAVWTVDEHVGKWAEVDETYVCSREVISNTADTLTLKYALDLSPVGNSITLYTPLEDVVLRNLTVKDVNGTGSANILIRYVNRLTLGNVRSLNSSGNCCSIYRCNDVQIIGGDYSKGGTFGLFVYDSEGVVALGTRASNNAEDYGIQFKDCRNARMIGCVAEGNGDVGLNIKCSGLNPSFNCEIIGGTTSRNTNAGALMHCLANEGTTYGAQNFSIDGHKSYKDGNGIQVIVGAGASMEGLVISNPLVMEATAIGITTSDFGSTNLDLTITNPRTIRCGSKSMDLDTPNTHVVYGRVKNGNYNGSTNPEIAIGANFIRGSIRGTRFVHSAIASKSNRMVQETAGADYNLYENLEHDDTVSTYNAVDIILTGTNSRAVNTVPRTLPLSSAVTQPRMVQLATEMSADIGDAAKSIYAGMERVQLYGSAITADRQISFQTAGAYKGQTFRVVRTTGATGAFNVVIRSVAATIKNLLPGQWADVTFNGTAWTISGSGSLTSTSGAIATSTDASGDVVVTHGYGTTPNAIDVAPTGTTFAHAQVRAKTATTFTVRFFDAAGAAIVSTAVAADWVAR